MSGAAGGAAAAAAAAAARAARMRQEEEDMTGYNASDLEGWEFKIVRSNTRKFKNREAVRQLCEEEAPAGWEMLEKFDDSRIRFKRKIEHRTRDQHLQIDPYRSEVGIGQGQMVTLILGAIVLLGGLVIWLATMAKQ
ncbi:MAG: hypothetical protein JSU74_01440 [Candidatus Zixiibacteriota bacterium]|nr:MAG: hypothetical protein JSU74_01440 [candidate division Zixibacteria bacterium]